MESIADSARFITSELRKLRGTIEAARVSAEFRATLNAISALEYALKSEFDSVSSKGPKRQVLDDSRDRTI